MTDRLGEALDHDDWRHENGMFASDPTIVAAARSWHTLTNPTDELIERVARAIQPWIDVDPATEHEWPLAQRHNARQAARVAVDALSDTADE